MKIDQPFGKLDATDLKSIQHIVREFCSTHDADNVHIILWDMLKLTLGSREAGNWTEQKRADYIFAYEGLMQLIEASYALTEQWKNDAD